MNKQEDELLPEEGNLSAEELLIEIFAAPEERERLKEEARTRQTISPEEDDCEWCGDGENHKGRDCPFYQEGQESM